MDVMALKTAIHKFFKEMDDSLALRVARCAFNALRTFVRLTPER